MEPTLDPRAAPFAESLPDGVPIGNTECDGSLGAGLSMERRDKQDVIPGLQSRSVDVRHSDRIPPGRSVRAGVWAVCVCVLGACAAAVRPEEKGASRCCLLDWETRRSLEGRVSGHCLVSVIVVSKVVRGRQDILEEMIDWVER